MVRQFRDQASELYRKNVPEKQKGITDFNCSRGDCCDTLWVMDWSKLLSKPAMTGNATARSIPPTPICEEGKPFMTPERLRECIEEKTGAMKPDDMELMDFGNHVKGIRHTMDGDGQNAAIAIADYAQRTVAQSVSDEEEILYFGKKVSNATRVTRTLYLSSECDSAPPGRSVRFGVLQDVSDAGDRVKSYAEDYLPLFEKMATQTGGFKDDITRIRDRTP